MTPLLLAPLELLYRSMVRPGMRALTAGLPQRLGWPVVSIGNLSVGGAGKTPLVICLAKLLQAGGPASRRLIPRLRAIPADGRARRYRAGARIDLGMNPC